MGSTKPTSSQSASQPSLTRLAARRLHNIATTDLSPTIKQKATSCLLDYLASISSGLSAPWASSLHRYATSRGGPQDSHLWGTQTSISAETAAFTNAAIAHSMIRDDMHLGAGSHIGVLVIPAALALAQRDNWTGEQLVRAIIGGYEMAAFLGIAARKAGHVNPHFRPSGIIGAFGAASAGIVATKNIPEDTAVHALGFAANMASGLNEWAWSGGLEIYTEMGTASRSGVIALDLAAAGLIASETALEGPDGLFAAYGGGSEGTREFKRLVEEAEIGTGIQGVRFKPVSGCNFTQTAVAAALKVNKELRGTSTDDIAEIRVTVTTPAQKYPGCDFAGPYCETGQTKMSIQFGVCAALALGEIDESAFTRFDHTGITRLVSLTRLTTEAAFDESFYGQGRQPARVEVGLKDGTRKTVALKDVPWLEGEAVEVRLKREMGSLGGEKGVEGVIEAVKGLWEAGNCRALFVRG